MNSRQLKRKINHSINLYPLVNVLRRLKRILQLKLHKRRINTRSSSRTSSKQKKSWVASIFLISVAVAIMLITIGVVVNFFSLQPQLSSLDWDTNDRTKIVGEQMNLMLLVYEKGDEYSFIDALGLLRIDFATNQHSLLLVSPKMAVNTFEDRRYTQIEALLGRSSLNDESPLDNLEDEIQDILGLQADRYLAVSRNNLLELMDIGEISFTSETKLDTGNIVIDQYQTLVGEELLAYLAAGKMENTNKQQARVTNLLTSQERAVFNWPTLLRYFLNMGKVSQLVETDLTRMELLDISTELLRNSNIRGDYISMQSTYLIQTDVGDYYVPNTTKVDEKIKKLLANRELIQEQARIEIYNATNINGLASQYSRSLNNLGANVIRAGNYPDFQSGNRLYVSEGYQKYSHNIDLIEQVLQGDVVVVDEPYPYNHTAELVLVLGRKDNGDK